jgi:hypothetical protein
VEFALIAPILILLVMGIIDYGLYFADSIALRQQTREVARQGSLAKWGPGGCTLPAGTTGSADVQKLMCRARTDAGTTSTAPIDVKVRFIDASSASSPETTYPTALAIQNGTSNVSVRICLLMTHPSITHAVPFPSSGRIKTRAEFRVENVTSPATVESGGTTSSTADWSWC